MVLNVHLCFSHAPSLVVVASLLLDFDHFQRDTKRVSHLRIAESLLQRHYLAMPLDSSAVLAKKGIVSGQRWTFPAVEFQTPHARSVTSFPKFGSFAIGELQFNTTMAPTTFNVPAADIAYFLTPVYNACSLSS